MTISKLKTKFALMLTACCALLPAAGNADYTYASDPCCPEAVDPCDPCGSWFGDWEVGADFIYWKPCINDLDYAIIFNDDPNISPVFSDGWYKYLDHDFEPGFRVYAAKRNVWCGWDISASYTWFWSKVGRSVVPTPAGTVIFSTLNHAGLNLDANSLTGIEASNSVRYQTFDVLFHHDFNCLGPCHKLIPYWGIEGVKIDQKTDSHSTGTSEQVAATLDVDWDSEVLALGLKIGTEYQYEISSCLNWFTDASISIVAGNNDTVNTQTVNVLGTAPIQARVSFKDCSDICMPGGHLMTGLSFEREFNGKVLRARVGYEFVQWWNVPKIRRYWSEDETSIAISTASVGSGLGLHGLFLGLDVGF